MLFQAEDSDPVVTGPNTKVSPVSTSNAHRALSKQLIPGQPALVREVIFRADSPARWYMPYQWRAVHNNPFARKWTRRLFELGYLLNQLKPKTS